MPRSLTGAGFPSSAELEFRLQELQRKIDSAIPGAIQDALLSRALANPFGEVSGGAGSIPPQISGLTTVPNVRSITFRWNASTISDLQFYEIQIATNVSFSADLQTFKTTETLFTFEEGDSNTPYFVKIRAISQTGAVGPFSSTLNETTGRARTEDVREGAINDVLVFQEDEDILITEQSGIFIPLTLFAFTSSATGDAIASVSDIAGTTTTFSGTDDLEVRYAFDFHEYTDDTFTTVLTELLCFTTVVTTYNLVGEDFDSFNAPSQQASFPVEEGKHYGVQLWTKRTRTGTSFITLNSQFRLAIFQIVKR